MKKKSIVPKNNIPKETTDRHAELILVNKELVYQNQEKEKRAAELVVANKELAYQNIEKERRAAELVIANKELAFQNIEKENRAAELVIANRELAFQNLEKENRAAELAIANRELAFQNLEKENRAAELATANKELAFQNIEKENRAAELVIANRELAFQNTEKEKRAAELILANIELAYQNDEKQKRAEELEHVNYQLASQIEETRRRTVELIVANKELESFTFISSHDLQEPLRKIQTFSSRILIDEYDDLSDTVKNYFSRMQNAALHMQNLINDLLAYSRTAASERKLENTNLLGLIEEVKIVFEEDIAQKNAIIETECFGDIYVIPVQFRQLLQNLIGNALKFSNPGIPPKISIKCDMLTSVESIKNLNSAEQYHHIIIQDNGIGFESKYRKRIFEIFQRLDNKKQVSGTGMGLTIVKKIVENHNGYISATGKLNKGARFDIYIPCKN
jgi:signal transduction histidine kinase